MPGIKDFNESLKILKERPNTVVFILVGWLFSLWLGYRSELLPFQQSQSLEILEIHKKLIQAEITIENNAKLRLYTIEPFLQQIVDIQNTPAWIKKFETASGEFKIVALNDEYINYYGVIGNFSDLNDIQLYDNRDFGGVQKSRLAQYAENDRRALDAGKGNCIEVQEYSFPVIVKDDPKAWFKKCLLMHKTDIFIYGHKI